MAETPPFLQNCLTLLRGGFALTKTQKNKIPMQRKLMDNVKKVVDFQLKFLHEEAKNFQDGNEDIQSKLVAQKREIETEYREMRKRCDPEIENEFSSDFVHYLTKLTATFSKAHILTTVSAIEGTERELSKTRKSLANLKKSFLSKQNIVKFFERSTRHFANLAEAANDLALRELISSEVVKRTLLDYFECFNRLNEDLAFVINEAVRDDISKEQQNTHLDSCIKISLDIEILMNDFTSTLEEEIIFLLKLDLNKQFLSVLQDLDNARLSNKDDLDIEIDKIKERNKNKLKRENVDRLTILIDESSDIIDLILGYIHRIVKSDQAIFQLNLVVKRAIEAISKLPSVFEQVVKNQIHLITRFSDQSQENLRRCLIEIKNAQSLNPSLIDQKVQILKETIESIQNNPDLQQLFNEELETKIQSILSLASVNQVVEETESFIQLLQEAIQNGNSLLESFDSKVAISLEESKGELVYFQTSLELNGYSDENKEKVTRICEKISDLIKLVSVVLPESDQFEEDQNIENGKRLSNQYPTLKSSKRTSKEIRSARSSAESLNEVENLSIKSGSNSEIDQEELQVSGRQNKFQEGIKEVNEDEKEEEQKEQELERNKELENLHPASWFYAAEETPEKEADDSRNIWKENWGGLVFEQSVGKMQIQAASLNQLLIRLTSTSPDALAASDFYRTFMLTMQTFTKPEIFVRKLIERYEVPECPQKGVEEKKKYDMQLKTPVQIRVCNLLKKWVVERYDQDLANNPGLIEDLFHFIDNRVVQDSEYLSTNLRRVLTLYITGEGFKYHQKLAQQNAESQQSGLGDMPITSNIAVKSYLSLAHFDPTEIAQQITLVGAELFKAIRLYELAGQSWNKPNAVKLSPNLIRLINYTNKISIWVANAICKEPILKKRRKIMSNMILLGQQLLSLRNFNGVMGVLGGLSVAAVARLKFTEKNLSPKVKKAFEDIQIEMSSSNSFKHYREKLKSSNSSAIPFIGLILSDITFVEDGNPDFTPDGLIHWSKRSLLYHVLSQFLEFQKTCLYDFPVNVSVKNNLLVSMEALNTPLKELYDISLVIEPRNGIPQEQPKSLLDRLWKLSKKE